MMQKPLFLSLLTLILLSCHRTDEKFCSCVKKSKEVNALSEKIWELEASKKDSVQFKKLISSKSKICEAYEYLSGEELLKLKKDCK
jgi:hypothetical protein